MTAGKKHPTAKKAPVVLLHGLGGSRHDWAAVEGLMKGHACLALDLPGDAQGPFVPSYEPPSLARWLSAALSAQGVDRAPIVAHSAWGRAAAELAATEPSRVSALALVAPLGAAGYGLMDTLKWKGMSRVAILRGVPEAQLRRALTVGFVADGAGRKSFIDRAIEARTGPNGAEVAKAIERTVDGVLGAPPIATRLRGTGVPLLVVTGEEDPLVPPGEAEAILKARPDAVAERLSGQGHYPMLEDPRRLAKALAELLSQAHA